MCAGICHEGCITIDRDSLSIDHSMCSTCTQCIAICPQQALSWDQIPPQRFQTSNLPTPQQLDELFRQRRTVRSFKSQRLDRETIESIIQTGILAPTNNYALRVVAVNDDAAVAELNRLAARVLRTIYNLVYRHKIIFGLLKRLTPGIQEKDKVKLEAGLEREITFDKSTAVLFIIGEIQIAHSDASAQYALANMMYYAQAMGLGTRLSGGGKILLGNNRQARRLLGLQKGEHILGVLEVGYPAVKFLNKVQGKFLPVEWLTIPE
jgi:nitroreductase